MTSVDHDHLISDCQFENVPTWWLQPFSKISCLIQCLKKQKFPLGNCKSVKRWCKAFPRYRTHTKMIWKFLKIFQLDSQMASNLPEVYDSS